jgi:hypothetical protein
LPNAVPPLFTADTALWPELVQLWAGLAKDAAQLPISVGTQAMQPMLRVCRSVLEANQAGAEAVLVIAAQQPALVLAAAQATSSVFSAQATKMLNRTWSAVAAATLHSAAPAAPPVAAPST